MFILLAIILAASPVDVSDQKQLFIDRRFMAENDRVELRTNPAQKFGMIMNSDGKPIQGHISRVIDDQGLVKLYLGADSVDVYESSDGLHFKGSGTRLSGGHFTTIFLDEHDPDPARRYKLCPASFGIGRRLVAG